MSNGIDNLTATTLAKLKEMLDANSVIGTPITVNPDTIVIPVSQVRLGYATGGSDFGTPNVKFGGGSGAGVTVTPVAMLVVSGNDARILQINPVSTMVDNIVETVPEVIDKIGGIVEAATGTNKKNSEGK